MKVIQSAGKQEPRVLALGMFDGVHRGHRELLKTGADLKRELGIPLRACTFDRHPMTIFRPEAAPPLLTTIPRKAFLMARAGVDEMQVVPFSRTLADRSPEEFLKQLRETVRIKAVVAGWNYTFGRGGAGTAEALAEDGRTYGYQVIILPPCTDEDGTVISSTGIRELLAAGKIREAGNRLGSPYMVSGLIREDGEGRLWVEQPGRNGGVMLPADGTYLCDLLLKDSGPVRRVPAQVENGRIFLPPLRTADFRGERVRISFRDRRE